MDRDCGRAACDSPLWHTLKYLRRLLIRTAGLSGRFDANELIYERLFSHFLTRHGLPNDFYPLGKAANFSFLYVLGRTIEECRVKSVLEFGTGQTTHLLDRLRPIFGFDAISFEDDEQWARQVGATVQHRVVHSPLRRRRIAGRSTHWYDHEAHVGDRRFDLVIVDGPRGKHFLTHSRWGALAAINQLARDFVVVFDDAERFAEAQTCRGFANACRRSFDDVLQHDIVAAKNQRLFCRGSMSMAHFF